MSVSSYVCDRLLEEVMSDDFRISKSRFEVYYATLRKIAVKYEFHHSMVLADKMSKLKLHSNQTNAKIQYCKLMTEINKEAVTDSQYFICMFIGTKYFMKHYLQHDIGVVISSSFWLSNIFEAHDYVWNDIFKNEVDESYFSKICLVVWFGVIILHYVFT